MYRFTLNTVGVDIPINPIYDDNLVIELARDSDSVRQREKINGSVTLVRSEFDLVNDAAFDTEFIFKVLELQDGAYVVRYIAKFYKTDCEFDLENRQVSIDLAANDRYSRTLSGLSKTFNLLEIPPKTSPVGYSLKPLFQVYELGADYITNLNGSNSWEQPVTPTTNSISLVNDYFFFEERETHIITGTGVLNPDVAGRYIFNDGNGDYESGQYVIRLNGGTWEILDRLNGFTRVYTGTNGQTDVNLSTFTPDGGSGTLAKLYSKRLFTRILSNKTVVNGIATNDIPTDDIVSRNRNYTKVSGYKFVNIFPSDANSISPSPYGQFDENAQYFAGNYFSIPVNTSIAQNFFEVGQSGWLNFSMWVYFTDDVFMIINEAKESRIVKDAYRLVDVIDAMLKKLDPTVIIEEHVTYSNFLHNQVNTVRGNGIRKVPVLVPKSNLLLGEYKQPASKGEISFQDIDDLIKKFYNSDWIIEDDKFIIEHISYFQNGRSYSAPNEVRDLSGILDAKTGKPLDFGTLKFKYKRETMPERYEFGFQEKMSQIFDGYPIEVRDKFAQAGNVERNVLGRIVTDLDFVLGNGEDVSKSGFVLLECTEKAGFLTVPDVTFQVGNLKQFTLQNGYAAIPYVQNKYWIYGLAGQQITMNYEDTTGITTKRTKAQSIDFAGITEFDYYGLVRTGLGLGEVEKASKNLSNGIIELDLLYDI